MKVFLRYEDNPDDDLHKTLKITLPKTWKTGPTSRLLAQFVESYNANENLGASKNPLQENDMHLALRQHDNDERSHLVNLPSDGIISELVPDRADVFVVHGPSQTLQEIEDEARVDREKQKEEQKNNVQCTHFGCKNRFPRGGPYPECHYHSSPPVFHETAKFWSCCPTKKAYDWDDFQRIPGCQTGVCSEETQEQKQFLGGVDLRNQAGEGTKLKSIDDFNKAQAAGGSDAAPVLDRLRCVMAELGIENELYDQVVDGMKRKLGGDEALDEAALLQAVSTELGTKLKAAMKTIAVEQLKIK